MPRPRASVPPEAIRIEDEVWQEAFARREPARPRPERRLHAIDGGRIDSGRIDGSHARPTPVSSERRPAPAPAATRPRSERTQVNAPRTAAAQRAFPPAPHARLGAPAAPRATAGGAAGRRTVMIRGYGAERNLPWPDSSSHRPQRRLHERSGFRPDRVAMWAVMLGILLVIVAVASPH